jgi:hypothetical protein
MKRLLLLTLLVAAATGCTARATVDMSILQKWDRPTDEWKVESVSGQKTATQTPVK